MKRNLLMLLGFVAALLFVALPAHAAVAKETAYIFNTLSFLMHGFLVMWMGAGFAMLEGGLVRSKNTSMQLLKNVAIYAVAGIMFYLVGFDLMFMNVNGGYFGTLSIWSAADAGRGNFSTGSDWFYQMVFVATAASIVSGTLAERIKLWPFIAFVVVLTAFIYPITGAWGWGGGWLSGLGFQDFAGSTLVHSVGGWAALSGAIILGPRIGKFAADGTVHPIPGANMPLATLGTFILWLGWFGFNGGSQAAMGSIADIDAIGTIYINTNLAAAAGVVTAMLLTQLLYKKVDLTMVLNGALAGLVAITAAPLTPSPGMALVIGAIGSILALFAVTVFDKLKIDDVVGALPVHLVAGIWGTLAVPLTDSGASFVSQLTGVVSIGAFVVGVSSIVWLILKYTVGIRVSEEEETIGLDKVELGLEAYPEFGRGSQNV